MGEMQRVQFVAMAPKAAAPRSTQSGTSRNRVNFSDASVNLSFPKLMLAAIRKIVLTAGVLDRIEYA